MAEQILEGVSPTRMDLLDIRKKLILAKKGHKLLEEKRDALVERFFDIIDKKNLLSKDIDEQFKDAFLSLIQAQMILGENKVEDSSNLSQNIGEIDFQADNIMGVKIPNIDVQNLKTEIKPSYGFSERLAPKWRILNRCGATSENDRQRSDVCTSRGCP